MESKNIVWRPSPTVCRCCFNDGCYKDISTEYFWMGKREIYSEMLTDTLDVSISYSQSGGPNSNSRLICEPCIARLRDASDFKKQVLECEKMFLLQLNPDNDSVPSEELETNESQMKTEEVKIEKLTSVEDFPDSVDFGGTQGEDNVDDDDDLDDEPLTKLASKIPKKEKVDLMDLVDNVKATEKRKSSSKAKSSPAKKAKTKSKTEAAQPSSSGSKVVPKKQKGSPIEDVKQNKVCRKLKENVSARTLLRRRRANNELPEESEKRIAKTMMRRNAMTLLESATLWAFRWCRNAFYCSYCDHKFLEKISLRQHLISVHLSEPITNKIFSKITENNMLKVDVSDIKCRICDQDLTNLECCKTHLVDIHGRVFNQDYSDGVLPFKLDVNDEHLCQKCDAIFSCFSKLNEHMNCHYQNYVCDSCGKPFVSKSRFRTHIQSHEVGSFPCGECDEVLETRVARMCHKFKVHRNCLRYACPRCSDKFPTYYSRAKHLNDKHGQQLKEYPCNFCDRTFPASCKRAAHFRTAHKVAEKPYPCSQCNWTFISRAQLYKHVQSYHQIVDK